MNKYSQNNEQEFILNYFNGYKGTFLDLGAYDGIELSNTRALMELGWLGMCFEPNPDIYLRLKQNCEQFGFEAQQACDQISIFVHDDELDVTDIAICGRILGPVWKKQETFG